MGRRPAMLVLRLVLLLGLVAALLTGCASGGGASASARTGTLVRAAAPTVPGDAERAFDLGRGVRVYAWWHPGRTELPWAIKVHGGSWRFGTGDDPDYVAWAQHEQHRGWVAFTVDYRLVPHVVWPAPEDDVLRATGWIRAHSSYFGTDPTRGFMIGHSAGGQLASIAALRLGGFAGVVDIAGAVDPYALYRHAPLRDLRQSAAMLVDHRVHDAALWRSARAETYLGPHRMPFLVMHSAHDRIVPYSIGLAFYRSLLAHGYPATLLTVRGHVHALLSAADNAEIDRWMDGVLAGRAGGSSSAR